ncbi:MAG TPA: ABC transporter permease, partial [Gemmatimonadaceae bacterium]|nr:ABC transporter permease [Gemmatimonadaceae bacterium]
MGQVREGGGERDERSPGNGVMSLSAGWRGLLRIWRRDPDADIDAELRFHFDEKVAELQARGASLTDARAQALMEFGDLEDVRHDLREIDTRVAVKHQRAEWWEATAQDARYALRTLRRSPAFTAMVATTLALGIGANAVIFSLLDRLFAREPAGVTAAGQLYRVQQRCKAPRCEPGGRFNYSYPELRAVRAALPGGPPLAGYLVDHLQFGQDDGAPPAVVSYVEGNFFGILGLRPAAGRFFSDDEARIQNVAPVAIISHQLWNDRFALAPSAVGQTVDVEAQRYTIIGVAPAGFTGVDLDAVDLWAPASTMRPVDPRSPWYAGPGGGGRLFRFVTRAESPAAAARLLGASSPVLGQSVRDTSATVALAPLAQAIWTDGGKVVAISTRLAGVAAIILLIACANVANLFLARGMQRRREVAVRLALGVSRKRLIGQLLGESLAVAMIGGAAAVVVAIWGGGVLRQILLPAVHWAEPAVGMRVAAFTAAIALLAGVAAGLVPALRASRPDLTSALKAGAREGTFRRSRLQTGLMVVQGALSVVLLAGAGLFVESLRHVEGVDIGYDADRLVLANVRYAGDRFGIGRDQEFKARLPEIADRIARLPGVERVGVADLPLMGGVGILKIFLPDRDSVPKLLGLPPLASTVSPQYLGAVGMRIVAGRGLTESDVVGSEPVIVVSASMAKAVWPGENALGKCVIVSKRTEPCRIVVGV